MKKINAQPPQLFLRFFRWFCNPQLRDHIEGDLMELYRERVETLGERKANKQFIIDVMLLCRPGIIKPAQHFQPVNNYDMFSNYLKVGIRNVLKYKTFSFINVFGLAVAMSVCLLIILMLAHQKSYDQFHEKKDRVYRILSDRDNSKLPSATTPFALADVLRTDYPAIEDVTHLTRGLGGEVSYNQKKIELRGYFADASFFNVFSYPLKYGNASHALSSPNSLILTSEYAGQLFGSENPVGKTVQLTDRGLSNLERGPGNAQTDWGLYTITGVIEDDNYKSHLKFNALISSSSRKLLYDEQKLADITGNWSSNQSYTYALLHQGKHAYDLTAALQDLIARKHEEVKDIKGFRLISQKLSEITPGMLVSNEPSYTLPQIVYYFLSGLAIMIMLSACLNYTTLTTARALTRAKEIGVRKVTGAYRHNVVIQFLCESMITALLSLVMAMLLLLFLKPAFEGLWINQYLEFDLQEDRYVYFIFIGFALFIGFIAGIYPALRLSRYQPIKALKNSESFGTSRLGSRKVLSASQFIISLFFITTSILLYRQFSYFMQFDYGFNSNNVVNIALQGNDYRKVSTAFSAVPGISLVSACNYVPATGMNNTMTLKNADSVDTKEEYKKLNILLADENFIGNLDIKLIAGRNLEATDSADHFIVVNEAAVKAFGYQYPGEIIGRTFEPEWSKEIYEVVGVVEDFCIKTPMGEDQVSPMVLRNEPHQFAYANVKILSKDVMGTLSRLREKWNTIDPAHPFNYSFYDQQLAAMHQALLDIVSILGFVAFLAITIACLGMLGMAMYTAERKRKEVGIRKVLGAADLGIALLLSKEFLKVLLIAITVGVPVSYFINDLWLQYVPNRVDFGFGTILLGTSILVALGLLTIGSQTIIASKQNPVTSLKVE